MLAITTDNATNNDTFITKLRDLATTYNMQFNMDDHHIHCIAHVMHLAVQDFLESIHSTVKYSENELFDDNEIETSIIPKVRWFLL